MRLTSNRVPLKESLKRHPKRIIITTQAASMVSRVIKIDRVEATKALAIRSSINSIEEMVTKDQTTRTNNTNRECRTTGASTMTLRTIQETCLRWIEQNWKVWLGNFYPRLWDRIFLATLTSCKICCFNKLATNFLNCLPKIRDKHTNQRATLPFNSQGKILNKT